MSQEFDSLNFFIYYTDFLINYYNLRFDKLTKP